MPDNKYRLRPSLGKVLANLVTESANGTSDGNYGEYFPRTHSIAYATKDPSDATVSHERLHSILGTYETPELATLVNAFKRSGMFQDPVWPVYLRDNIIEGIPRAVSDELYSHSDSLRTERGFTKMLDIISRFGSDKTRRYVEQIIAPENLRQAITRNYGAPPATPRVNMQEESLTDWIRRMRR